MFWLKWCISRSYSPVLVRMLGSDVLCSSSELGKVLGHRGPAAAVLSGCVM
jgi:hypothetical protein